MSDGYYALFSDNTQKWFKSIGDCMDYAHKHQLGVLRFGSQESYL